MGTLYFDPSNNSFDALFAPDVVGDGPVATGFFQADGVTPLKYAAAKYGSPGEAVGIFLAGSSVDMGNQWAQIGTPNYSLSINGETFSSESGTNPGSPSGSNLSSINFEVDAASATWAIGKANKSVVTPITSGPIPAGSAYLQITVGPTSIADGADKIYGGTFTNTASSPTSIVYTGGSTFERGFSFVGNTAAANNPNNLGVQFTLTIVFYNAAVSPISTTTITFVAEVASGE